MKLKSIRQLGRDQRGLSTVEYTVLLVLIVAVTVGLWNDFGGTLVERLTTARDEFRDKTKTKK